jgi:hypothetical protein
MQNNAEQMQLGMGVFVLVLLLLLLCANLPLYSLSTGCLHSLACLSL